MNTDGIRIRNSHLDPSDPGRRYTYGALGRVVADADHLAEAANRDFDEAVASHRAVGDADHCARREVAESVNALMREPSNLIEANNGRKRIQ